MTFFRHFIERKDFKTLVVTNSQHLKDYNLPYTPIHFSTQAWLNRLSKTRFLPWIYGFQCLYGKHLLPTKIIQASERFCPEAVFTVAGSWDWTALAAQRIARYLKVPLIASFNDWFDYGWFPAHNHFRQPIEARFRRFYQEADLALCTSEGMRDALGPHPNVHVLYPTGATMLEDENTHWPIPDSEKKPFTVFFGGNLGDWYGPMIESVITQGQQIDSAVRFQIFGIGPSWSQSFEQWAKASGVFAGQVPFEQLRQEARKADLLLLPMGFDQVCAQIERTSFKTKFLDYLSFQRPILVWGPEYCSAVRKAREFDSAECVTLADPTACIAAIQRLAANPNRRSQLIANARHMYEARFHPDIIHTGLVRKIREIIKIHQAA
ncbi:MAG: glycosyltransferase family 4 protein [Cyanothece sp. SIO1E1]|nr:glycosyltransferase family 4 protein [Cyanothece sp. SIO1E1]